MDRKYIARVWVDDHAVYAETTDGLRAGYEFAQWSRLRNATATQRQAFELSYGGIHWPDIDEDLSFEGMFHDAGLTTPKTNPCPPQRKNPRSTESNTL